MKSVFLSISYLFMAICTICACQRAPRVSAAANPDEALAAAPMGSPTNNASLKEKKALLLSLLDGKLLLTSSVGSEENEESQKARSLLQAISIEAQQLPLRGVYRNYAIANFYFQERRFIESAQFLSQVLDLNPLYPYARNLLARCFYFLGNSDRSILELEYILVHQSHDPGEFIDALFLAGMIIDESLTTNQAKVKKGIKFLKTYLKAATISAQREKAEASLKRLQERL